MLLHIHDSWRVGTPLALDAQVSGSHPSPHWLGFGRYLAAFKAGRNSYSYSIRSVACIDDMCVKRTNADTLTKLLPSTHMAHSPYKTHTAPVQCRRVAEDGTSSAVDLGSRTCLAVLPVAHPEWLAIILPLLSGKA